MYPCVLTHRTSPALILTATNRSQEAFALLEYPDYDRGGIADRSDREAASII
jgi:hypothetical protein